MFPSHSQNFASRPCSHGRAMHSISTSTPLGSCLTATQLRAGLWTNHLAYSSFMFCVVDQISKHRGILFPWDQGLGAYGKVGHVGQEDVALDDLFDRRAGLLEDSLEVGNAGSCLLLDGALDEVALGVTGDLARAVDGVGRLDGLGLHQWALDDGHPGLQWSEIWSGETNIGPGSCASC